MTIKNRLLYPARGKLADAYRYATKKLGFAGGGELHGGGIFDTIFGVVNKQLNIKIKSFNTVLSLACTEDGTEISQNRLDEIVKESKQISDQFVKETTDLTNAISKEAEKLDAQNPESDQIESDPSLAYFQQYTDKTGPPPNPPKSTVASRILSPLFGKSKP